MLVDSAGLVLALGATALARRPPDLRRSYGYARVEVLVVPLHVLFMLGLMAYIVYEAVSRLGEHREIAALPVLFVGVLGLVVNALVFRLLHHHSEQNLNVRGALFEVTADALGSAGLIVSAVVILATGWTPVDVIVSLVIAALVVPRALALLRRALGILLEGAPSHLRLDEIEADARQVPGVLALHDLHVWSLAPSFVALSAHVEVESMAGCEDQIAALSTMLRERHEITHVTLQPETRALHELVQCCDYPDSTEELGHLHEPATVTG
jgi:cobalt-zinc-cadmium efflux system protein